MHYVMRMEEKLLDAKPKLAAKPPPKQSSLLTKQVDANDEADDENAANAAEVSRRSRISR